MIKGEKITYLSMRLFFVNGLNAKLRNVMASHLLKSYKHA